MAITKIKCLKASNGSSSHKQSTSLYRCLDYIINEDKTEHNLYVSGYNCNYLSAYREMMNVKEINNKTWGRQGYHFIISFSPEDNVDEDTAFDIMHEFCYKYLKKEYQAVFAVHNDQNHLHGHLVFNSVNMMTGLKYRYNKGDWKKYIQPIVNDLCEQFNLSTISLDETNSEIGVENDKKNLSYENWKANKRGTKSWGDIYREDIDRFIASSYSFDEFVNLLLMNDYEIKNTGKYFGIRTKVTNDGKEHKFRRLHRLGDNYSIDAIKQRIADNVREKNKVLLQNGNVDDLNKNKQLYSVHVCPTVMFCKVNRNFNYKEYTKINPLKSSFVKRLYDIGCFRNGRISYSNKQIRYDMKHIDNLNSSISFLCSNSINSIDDLNNKLDSLNAYKKELYNKKKELIQMKKQLKEGEPDIYKEKILNVSRKIDKQLDDIKICLRIKNEFESKKKDLER